MGWLLIRTEMCGIAGFSTLPAVFRDLTQQAYAKFLAISLAVGPKVVE